MTFVFEVHVPLTQNDVSFSDFSVLANVLDSIIDRDSVQALRECFLRQSVTILWGHVRFGCSKRCIVRAALILEIERTCETLWQQH